MPLRLPSSSLVQVGDKQERFLQCLGLNATTATAQALRESRQSDVSPNKPRPDGQPEDGSKGQGQSRPTFEPVMHVLVR